MKINRVSNDSKDYINFVVEGLEKWDRSERVIETINVYYSSISVNYRTDMQNPTEMLYIHEHIRTYGLDVFISKHDIISKNTVSYRLE